MSRYPILATMNAVLRSVLLGVCAVTVNVTQAEEPQTLSSVPANCPAGVFPTTLEDIASRPRLPLLGEAEQRRDTDGKGITEIRDLKVGLVRSVVGISVNDGLSTWRAIDFDRRIVVEIESISGPALKMSPNVLTASERAGTIKRVRQRGPLGPAVDTIRTAPMTDAELLDVACLANRMVVLSEAAQEMKELSVPRERIADIAASNVTVLGEHGLVDYALVKQNEQEHDQLLRLMAAKFRWSWVASP